MSELIIGADVGGSSTRVAVATLTGGILRVVVEGPGNPNLVGLAGSAEVIRGAVEGVLAGVPGTVVSVVIGLAGGSRATDGPGFARAAVPERVAVPAVVVSDLAVAFSSATPAARGCTLVAGTGAVAARVVGEEIRDRRDGWGWLLGDRGSGFWLGRAAVRATLQALDEDRPLGGMHRDVLAAAGCADQAGLLQACYAQPPTWLARLAPVVSRWADHDPVAGALADRAADLLVATLSGLHPGTDEPVVLCGSVLGSASPIGARVAARLPPGLPLLRAESGLVGATWVAARRLGRESAELHARLVATAAPAPRVAPGLPAGRWPVDRSRNARHPRHAGPGL